MLRAWVLSLGDVYIASDIIYAFVYLAITSTIILYLTLFVM